MLLHMHMFDVLFTLFPTKVVHKEERRKCLKFILHFSQTVVGHVNL